MRNQQIAWVKVTDADQKLEKLPVQIDQKLDRIEKHSIQTEKKLVKQLADITKELGRN
jgi:hypothetical protein